MKIIKLTEDQMRLINEAPGMRGFADAIPDFPSSSVITADGATGDDFGNPQTGDNFSHQETQQLWLRRNAMMPQFVGTSTLNMDAQEDEVDYPDEYNNPKPAFRESKEEPDGWGETESGNKVDALSNEYEDDDKEYVPNTILVYLDRLVNEISNQSLNPRQKALVLNAVIEKLDTSIVPNAWKKELSNKILGYTTNDTLTK